MSPVAYIFHTIELGIRFYRWAIIGPQYSKTQRNMSMPMTIVKGWVDQAKLMKFPYKHKWWNNLSRDGHWILLAPSTQNQTKKFIY
jgi:hypothetical protein